MATELVSKLMLIPHKGETPIDIRTVRLPSKKPSKSVVWFDVTNSDESLEDRIDSYDPRDHRVPAHKIKVWMAYINLLRSMCGAGMLGMPLVISQLGILFGPTLTLATGLLIVYTHKMLLNSLYEVSRQLRIPYISYRYGFRIAVLNGPPILHPIGHHGPTIVATFMLASQLGLCTVCVIFTTDGLRDVLDIQDRDWALICLFLPYLIMQFFMKTLKIVSYVAMFGNLFNLAAIILMLEHILFDQHGEVTTETDLMGIAFGFGSLLFNLNAVGVTLSLDKSLEDPRRLTSRFGVLNVGILCPTIIGMMFGCLGYYAFGTMEENILRSLPFDSASAMATIVIYSVSIGFVFPLQCHPAVMIIAEIIKYHNGIDEAPTARTLEIIKDITRPLFVLTSFLISYFVPFQGPFIAFVGNLCTTMLALVFPALMDISLRYPSDYGEYYFHLYVDLFIIGLGLVSMVYGAYLCGYLIYIRILSRHSSNYTGFY